MGGLGDRESDLGGVCDETVRTNDNFHSKKAAAYEILKPIPDEDRVGKTTVIHNLDTTQDIYTETSTDNLRPSCCSTVSLKSMTSGIPKQICLRALVCNDVTTDLIIGLPSIRFFN